MNNLERDNLIDGFFNKGYACDLKDVYQAIMGTIKDLEKANDEKVKKIESLNNIINELEKWLESEIDRVIKLINPKKVIKPYGEENYYYENMLLRYKEVLDKLQELKGSDKE